MLIHGLDNLNATIELNDLIQKNDLETRNLTIQGNMLSECLEEKTTKKGQSTTKFFCPLVADSWKSGEPIHVLAQIDDIPDNEFNSLFEKSEFQGVLRNVLWEGPSNSTKDFFIKEYGATMAPNVLEFEVNGDSKNDLYLFLLIFSIVEVLIGGITIYLFKKSFS